MNSINDRLKNADAAVVYIMGQSNAHAHAQVLNEDEIIKSGLNHVFTLDYRIDRSLDNDTLTWRQYTSQYNNLGEHQDNTCTLGYNIAKEWEKRIDNGEKLPDLYIVQISEGCMGILNGQWNMDLENKIKEDAPLYHLALHTDRLVYKDLNKKYKNPVALGFHWIGSESDAVEPFCSDQNFRKIYDKFFDDIMDSIGFECPMFLYRLVHYKNGTPKAKDIDMINGIFSDYTKHYKNCVMISAAESELWDGNDENSGVFSNDKIHYLADTQRYFCKRFFELSEK